MPNPNTSRYRLLIENSGDLVAELSREGRFLYVSPNFQTVLGYAPEDLIGNDIFAQIHPDDQESARHCFALPAPKARTTTPSSSEKWT